jgi:intracellular sulfur oxidation DsrE/DsrF family protein
MPFAVPSGKLSLRNTMRRTLTLVALTALTTAASGQQVAGPVINAGGKHAPVPNVTFGVPTDFAYKVVWDIEVGGTKPGELNDEYNVPARFVNQGAALGLPRWNVSAAVVIHGTAGEEMLTNEEYKARKGVDNPNIAILEEMSKAGVKIILCGQTVDSRKMPRDKILPFVLIAPSAAWANAVLLRQGYTANPF